MKKKGLTVLIICFVFFTPAVGVIGCIYYEPYSYINNKIKSQINYATINKDYVSLNYVDISGISGNSITYYILVDPSRQIMLPSVERRRKWIEDLSKSNYKIAHGYCNYSLRELETGLFYLVTDDC